MPPSARSALQPLSSSSSGFNIPRDHGGLFFGPGLEPSYLPGASSRSSHNNYTPQQIRRKITVFLQNSGTLVKDFKAQLGVGDGTYGRFMREHGSKTGWESDTFVAACEFFRDREARGEKMPKPSDNPKNKSSNKKNSGAGSKRKSDASNDDTGVAKKQKKTDEKEGLTDVSDVYLPGEESEDVPIYNTCDEIRRKMRRLLAKPGVTQTAFARALSAQYPEASEKKVAAHNFRTFLARSGPQAGAESNVFYAAYVWFEKERVKFGKKKDKHREEMEDVWGGAGMDRMDGSRRGLICLAGTRPAVDEFGKMEYVRV
ncbi:hypothetical protein MMC10_003330 [Thelotrema lepadinum]|nr:hypothetical protein [Thelotrema lepadinum]